MEKIEVIKSGFKIHEGVVLLNENQARRRKSFIEKISEGKYRVLKTIGFKIGEKLEVNSIEGYSNQLISLIARQGSDISIKEEKIEAKAQAKAKAKEIKAEKVKAEKIKAEKAAK